MTVIGLLALGSMPVAVTAQDEELAVLMMRLQTFTHKLQLSLEHANGPLAEFYVHEIEELIEEVGEIEEYDGQPVGQLASTMLAPAMDVLESRLEAADFEAAAAQPLDALIAACNACHIATGYGFIVIARNSENPYLQSFEP